jgi:hypothetical protein
LVKNACCPVIHNGLYDLFPSPNVIRLNNSRVMRWAGHAERIGGERRGAYRVLVGQLEAKRPLGRPMRKWEDNIKIYPKRLGDVDWIDLAQDRDRWWALVNAVMNRRILP